MLFPISGKPNMHWPAELQLFQMLIWGPSWVAPWASLAQRFPASSVLAREGAGCGSVGDVTGSWLASAPLEVSVGGRRVLGLPWWLSWLRICLQCGRPRFDPWVGKIPWRRDLEEG